MLRAVLLGVYVLSFVAAFVLTSAAFEQTSVAVVAAELMRAPATILTPGLEGNTPSQLLAAYNAAAIVAAVAYAAVRTVSDGYGAVMVGLSAFPAGVALILAAGVWSNESAATDWSTWALSAVATLLAVRWWYLAARATRPAAAAPLGPLARANYWLAAILLAAGPSVLLTAQLIAAMKALLPLILLFGAPLLLVCYLLAESLLMRAKAGGRFRLRQ